MSQGAGQGAAVKHGERGPQDHNPVRQALRSAAGGLCARLRRDRREPGRALPVHSERRGERQPHLEFRTSHFPVRETRPAPFTPEQHLSHHLKNSPLKVMPCQYDFFASVNSKQAHLTFNMGCGLHVSPRSRPQDLRMGLHPEKGPLRRLLRFNEIVQEEPDPMQLRPQRQRSGHNYTQRDNYVRTQGAQASGQQGEASGDASPARPAHRPPASSARRAAATGTAPSRPVLAAAATRPHTRAHTRDLTRVSRRAARTNTPSAAPHRPHQSETTLGENRNHEVTQKEGW